MSRGRRGWRGGPGRGRGNALGVSMGLTFAEIQSLPREASGLYPPYESLPTIVTDYTTEEKRICELQLGFSARLRNSAYYLVESTKSTELPRYSDKYRPSPASQPTLKRRDLHQPFFPPDIFEGYFNPKKRRKTEAKPSTKKMNLDEVKDEEQDKTLDEPSDVASQERQSDYDVDEEYDNDYADNYFDNGENDDLDDTGGGIGGDDHGGGGDYD